MNQHGNFANSHILFGWKGEGKSMALRTSVSHPLYINAVTIADGHGRIGVTFWPGKYDPHAMTGGWDRDLEADGARGRPPLAVDLDAHDPALHYELGKALATPGEKPTAELAASAMKILREQDVSVVVSDIGMPGEDGYSLIRRLRQLAANEGGATPAVALTAYARENEHRAALETAVQGNEKSVALAQERYLHGLDGFLNVLQAQQQLYAARAHLVTSQATVLMNLIALYKALGGGWDASE